MHSVSRGRYAQDETQLPRRFWARRFDEQGRPMTRCWPEFSLAALTLAPCLSIRVLRLEVLAQGDS